MNLEIENSNVFSAQMECVRRSVSALTEEFARLNAEMQRTSELFKITEKITSKAKETR